MGVPIIVKLKRLKREEKQLHRIELKWTEQNELKGKNTEKKCWKCKSTEPKFKIKEEQQLENESAEPKYKNTSLRHEYQKRRKEGEEKAHEDGRMVGWSRH